MRKKDMIYFCIYRVVFVQHKSLQGYGLHALDTVEMAVVCNHSYSSVPIMVISNFPFSLISRTEML